MIQATGEKELQQSTMTTRTVYFSPTGTTKKVVQSLAKGCGGDESAISEVDLTPPPTPKYEVECSREELAVIGVPVYAGRVAPLAALRLRCLRGNDTPAVVVVTYGNREYEDALIELREIVAKQSFRVIAAGAFIGEHSFSSEDMPIAHGRPDTEDLSLAEEFGRRVKTVLGQNAPDALPEAEPIIPGNIPYKEGMGNMPFTPAVDESLCTLCAVCGDICPSGAITVGETVSMKVDVCIHCCACIKICPEGALAINSAPLLEKKKWLHDHCRERKEPELFI